MNLIRTVRAGSSSKLAHGGNAVYPSGLVAELEANVCDSWIDCARMPAARDLQGKEEAVVHDWLEQVSTIREQQTPARRPRKRRNPVQDAALEAGA